MHPCNLPRPSALLCICESGGGHYTNHRGDTLGASPKTRERETGMKNFETNFETLLVSTVHKNKPVYDGSVLDT